MDINKVSGFSGKLELNKAKDKSDNSIFGDYLKGALDNVNKLQLDSENMSKQLATGQINNLHEVTIAGEKANIALQLTLGIRNKVIDAYKEIMRMQI